MREQEVVTDSLQEAASARKGRRRADQKRVRTNVKNQSSHKTEVQERFQRSARFAYSCTLRYAKWEASELYFHWGCSTQF